MNKLEDDLYKKQLDNIMSNLEKDYKFEKRDIEYGNVELISNYDDSFTISFQKQNYSFTVAMKNEIKGCPKIIVQLRKIVGLEFATYNFSDLDDYNVYHFTYDKKEFNKKLLDSLKHKKEIINLVYNN